MYVRMYVCWTVHVLVCCERGGEGRGRVGVTKCMRMCVRPCLHFLYSSSTPSLMSAV